MTFIPSAQQSAVLDWISNGTGSAFIEAVAGAGKTTTLIEALSRTAGSVAFTAYNKKIAQEIADKVSALNLGGRVRVGTFHSFGYGAWRKVHPLVKLDEKQKQFQVHAALAIPDNLDAFVAKLVSLAKQRAIGLFGAISDTSLWYDIVDHFDLAYEIEDPVTIEQGIGFAQKALQLHRDIGSDLIDFDDMIWLPVVSGIRMWENDWIFVDEAQDTNPARRALARKILRRGGRAAFVGDRHQAIYGFTGADADAIDQITRDFNCSILPLTTTFRCPKAVVREAQKVVSHIQAHETAPEGSVEYATINAFSGLPCPSTPTETGYAFRVDDAILCRVTKPLVEMAYALIRRGIACHVEGKDIGIGLLKLSNRWSVKTLDQLRAKLEIYAETETAKLIAKGRETQAEALQDRVETLLVIAETCQTLADLRGRILSMFQDGEHEAKPTLTLSTVHKAKGREWNRVFILGRDQYMPSKWARQEWQMEQEQNLIYVACTRAKEQLILLDMPATKAQEKATETRAA